MSADRDAGVDLGPPCPPGDTSGGFDSARPEPIAADLLLVSCVKTKLAVPAAAKDLYISASFEKQRKYAEACGVPWFILSAKYGLVAPKERIEPHELYLPATSASYRASWGIRTVDRLAELAGALQGITVEIARGPSIPRCGCGSAEVAGRRRCRPPRRAAQRATPAVVHRPGP